MWQSTWSLSISGGKFCRLLPGLQALEAQGFLDLLPSTLCRIRKDHRQGGFGVTDLEPGTFFLLKRSQLELSQTSFLGWEWGWVREPLLHGPLRSVFDSKARSLPNIDTRGQCVSHTSLSESLSWTSSFCVVKDAGCGRGFRRAGTVP